jgi:tripartite-type tricarboxylate transporter receptor subunit TctC
MQTARDDAVAAGRARRGSAGANGPCVLLAIALCTWPTGHGYAQQYTVKPIRITVPNQAGGTSNNVARIFGQQITETLKQQVWPE